jgi:3'-phosphoadenosine 5'-phosphosulfate sulfotransferase (PAPS reductase)/FAD synthetase
MSPKAIDYFIRKRALFVINHSGGKDSQAMTAYLRAIIPADQLVVIHAHLPGVEWEGVREHIQDTTAGLPYFEVRNENKTFLEMVVNRGKWPGIGQRQCTSDLKRGPIEKQIRALAKQRNCRLIISCMGLRAQESTNRAKQPEFKMNKSGSVAGRKWYNWNPIHSWDIKQVWETIKQAGQVRHWAYDAGMTRLSCCFCIMASKVDLTTAKQLRPDLFAQYVAIEKQINHTFIMPKKGQPVKFLDEII